MNHQDMCMVWLICDKNMKPNWDAGHKAINDLEDKSERTDGMGRIESGSGEMVDIDKLHTALNYLEHALNTGSDETSTIEVGHLNIIISGGPSYGEDPTQLYTEILKLDDAGIEILQAVGYHQQQDLLDYKEILLKIITNKQILPLLIGIDENLDELITPRIKK